MLHWLLQAADYPASPTARALAAFLTATVVALLLGSRIIRWLQHTDITEHTEKTPIEDDQLKERIRKKTGTPTMGGLIIALGLAVGCLLWGKLNDGQLWMALACFAGLSALGIIDDWMKLHHENSDGIKVRYKLLAQSGIGAVIGGFVIFTQPDWWQAWLGHFPWLPAGIAAAVLLVWCGLVLATMSNAVNVSDGLDGLAGGLTIIALIPLAWILVRERHTIAATSDELIIYVASMTGGVAGFLYYNWHPARVFMGDTGSLAVGGGIGLVALLSGVELALPIIALVLLLELASSVLQVLWFKTTGRRILPISPLHHIWEQKNVPEQHIVTGFLLTGFVITCLFTPLF